MASPLCRETGPTGRRGDPVLDTRNIIPGTKEIDTWSSLINQIMRGDLPSVLVNPNVTTEHGPETPSIPHPTWFEILSSVYKKNYTCSYGETSRDILYEVSCNGYAVGVSDDQWRILSLFKNPAIFERMRSLDEEAVRNLQDGDLANDGSNCSAQHFKLDVHD